MGFSSDLANLDLDSATISVTDVLYPVDWRVANVEGHYDFNYMLVA